MASFSIGSVTFKIEWNSNSVDKENILNAVFGAHFDIVGTNLSL